MEIIRILKYLRDTKLTFSCKSILLTTLIGQQITLGDMANRDSLFADIPTSLKTLIVRLDLYLQHRPKLHDVVNPVLSGENFVRHWDEEKYVNFRDVIHRYSDWICEPFDEVDPTTSLEKWQGVFGDEFGKDAGGTKSKLIKFDDLSVLSASSKFGAEVDAVEAVETGGKQLLVRIKEFVPWMKPSPWRNTMSVPVRIRATKHQDRTGYNVSGELSSGDVCHKGVELRFEALAANQLLFGKDFDVQWQVVNSDREAWADDGLRGGFYKSDSRAIRWESTKYRGVHWVQAFVIRKRDRGCVGRSDRFFVLIE